ncbi:hypothetical protein [Mycolicibacterium austroafricanum]|uniref:hypothetical protein n=1 Tax=Mycolicibacterium austroafricanum TaxID=39687 RepID=UPI001CA34ABB|nr:hypothetical protein [Mycolicibacterium austroafricanum]QZT55110.1 hypothetical protein JN084_19140 [Mycolicibacterium austroafricanum]
MSRLNKPGAAAPAGPVDPTDGVVARPSRSAGPDVVGADTISMSVFTRSGKG